MRSGRAGGNVIQMWRIDPGPFDVGEHDPFARLQPLVRRALAAAVRGAARAARPVGFSNVTAAASRGVGSTTAGFDGGIDHRRARQRVGHRLETLGDPRTIGRHVERDRAGSGTRSPTPAAAGRSCSARDEWSVRGWWKLTPPARIWIGTAAVVSIGVDELEEVHRGSSPTCRCGSTSPWCEPGRNHMHPLSTSTSSSGIHAADGVVRRAAAPSTPRPGATGSRGRAAAA